METKKKKKFTLITLISEDGNSISIGRVAFWIGLGVALYYWLYLVAIPFPISLVDFLGYVLAYNCVKKGIKSYDTIKTKDISEKYSHYDQSCNPPRQSERRSRINHQASTEEEFDKRDYLRDD